MTRKQTGCLAKGDSFKNYLSKGCKTHPSTLLEAPVRIYGDTLVKKNVKIGRFSYLHTRSTIHAGTKIGRYCSIGKNVDISPYDHPMYWLSSSPISYNAHLHFPDEKSLFIKNNRSRKKAATLGSDVWIASKSVILRGITIGHGSIVGAGSTVTKDVPPFSIVAENPAKLIKMRFDEETILRFLATAWWDQPLDVVGKLLFDDPLSCLSLLEAQAETKSGALSTAAKPESGTAIGQSVFNAENSTDESGLTKQAPIKETAATAEALENLKTKIRDIENGVEKPISVEAEFFVNLLSQKLNDIFVSGIALEFIQANARQYFHAYDHADHYDQVALNNKVLQIAKLTENLGEIDELPRSVQKTILSVLSTKA